jgi:hypothetical protein
LENLKRIRHVSGTRHARHIAANFWVEVRPVFLIRLSLGQRFRLVRNGATFNDAKPRRNRADRAHADDARRRDWIKLAGHHLQCSTSRVRLKIPVSAVQCLPNTIEVWLAVRQSRHLVGGRIGRDGADGGQDRGCGNQCSFECRSHWLSLSGTNRPCCSSNHFGRIGNASAKSIRTLKR